MGFGDGERPSDGDGLLLERGCLSNLVGSLSGQRIGKLTRPNVEAVVAGVVGIPRILGNGKRVCALRLTLRVTPPQH